MYVCRNECPYLDWAYLSGGGVGCADYNVDSSVIATLRSLERGVVAVIAGAVLSRAAIIILVVIVITIVVVVVVLSSRAFADGDVCGT